MANLDSRNKRASALGIALAPGRVYPNPDGSLANQGDRQQMAYSYAGVETPEVITWTGRAGSFLPIMGAGR